MTRRLLGLVLALVLLGGCVSLPTGGAVSTRPADGPVGEGAGTFDYTPAGPRKGAPPQNIVYDFLRAMEAAPQSTAVAREYLTDEARSRWFPERSTLLYDTQVLDASTGGEGAYVLRLDGTYRLDDRGTWLGRAGGDDGIDYGISLVRERGEWRIDNPPDSLLVTRQHFESRYQQYLLYFFDPTGEVLVPEPTYLPYGEQAPATLVRRLLRGPHPRVEGVVRSYIPAGTEHALSVPVSEGGVVDVGLNRQLLQLSGEQRQRALAQLAWTLGQVTGVESLRVTVGGEPLGIPGAGNPISVSSFSEFDPAIHWASREVFGIQNSRVVALSADVDEVVGRFGADEYALRSIAVDLAGERVAGVSEDGTTVVLAPRGRTLGEAPPPEETRVVHTGTDVLRPSWNVFDELWLVDRTAGGLEVSVAAGDRVGPVPAPGLARRDVTAFVVSRDGTRLVAAVNGQDGDHLEMMRVLRTQDGRVRGLTRPVELPLAQPGPDEIRDLAWRTPGGLAVLTTGAARSAQVLLALVDGSPALPDVDASADLLRLRSRAVVAAPSSGAAVLLGGSQGELFELAGDGQWVEVPLEDGLLSPTYAG